MSSGFCPGQRRQHQQQHDAADAAADRQAHAAHAHAAAILDVAASCSASPLHGVAPLALRRRAAGPYYASMDLQLSGQVAIVTGSSRGLGLAIAMRAGRRRVPRHPVRAFARPRSSRRRRLWRREPAAPIACWPWRRTSARPPASSPWSTRTVDSVWRRRRAGQQPGPRARRRDLLDTTDADWQEALDQTLFPAIRASRLAVPHMQQRGGGAIVIVASIFGREAGGRMTYNAVKAAEISLAKSLAQQLAPSNIRVNSVSPGSILFEGGSWWKRQQERSGRHCRVRQARAAVRPLRPAGRGRRRGRVPGVAARQLDQRHVGRGRRLPEPGVLKRPQAPGSRLQRDLDDPCFRAQADSWQGNPQGHTRIALYDGPYM